MTQLLKPATIRSSAAEQEQKQSETANQHGTGLGDDGVYEIEIVYILSDREAAIEVEAVLESTGVDIE